MSGHQLLLWILLFTSHNHVHRLCKVITMPGPFLAPFPKKCFVWENSLPELLIQLELFRSQVMITGTPQQTGL